MCLGITRGQNVGAVNAFCVAWFNVLTAVKMTMFFFWDLTPRGLVVDTSVSDKHFFKMEAVLFSKTLISTYRRGYKAEVR
jgi:hypothetical protein